MDSQTRRDRREARGSSPAPRPGPRKRDAGPSRPVWQTVLWGIGLVVVALFVAVTLTSETPTSDATETAPVEVTGEALPAFPEPGTEDRDPAVGSPAPDATGVSFDDSASTLLSDGDQATLVVFLAHWCPHCQREVPVLVDHLGGDLPSGVRVVGVPTATDPGQGNFPPSSWLEREDWPFDVLVDSEDGELAAAYGVTSFPAFAMVGADGTVTARGSGELTPEALDQLLSSVAQR